MSSLPVLTASDVIRKLRKAGFVFDRHAKGSHEISGIILTSAGVRLSPITQAKISLKVLCVLSFNNRGLRLMSSTAFNMATIKPKFRKYHVNKMKKQ